MNNRRSKNTVRIQDVAAQAGVSVSTVSRVINNKGDVSQETVARVRAVISQMDYTSSLAARSLRSRKSNVIGLIIPDLEESYCILIMKGVNRAISELEYDLIVYTSGNYHNHYMADRERSYVSLLDNSITDGVIVVAPAASHFSTAAPLVAVDPHIECPDYPSVSANNREGAHLAVSYLLDLGHERIGFIGGRRDLESAIQRQQGYEDCLMQADLDIDPDLIIQGNFTYTAGLQGGRRLLSLPNPPTAIFAANDKTALGVYAAAEEIGLNIPDDLSVVGFDDIPEAAQIRPGLTTIDQSIEKMGYTAMQILIKLIEGAVVENKLHKMPTQIILRESCRMPLGVPAARR